MVAQLTHRYVAKGHTESYNYYTMRCIVCREIADASDEHVFPHAIGGNLIVKNVCSCCNRKMGHSIDSHLAGNFLVQMTMLALQIPGSDGRPKTSFYNRAAVSEDGRHFEYVFGSDGRPTRVRHPFIFTETPLSTGKTKVEVTADIDDMRRMLKAINGKRRKLALPEFGPEELVEKMQIIEMGAPAQRLKFTIDFDRLSIAMYKIAYELAHLWIGPAYANDEWAEKIRTELIEATRGEYSTRYIKNIRVVGTDTRTYDAFHDKPTFNIAFLKVVQNRIFAHIRILNTLQGDFLVSENADRYKAFVPKIVLDDARSHSYEILTLKAIYGRLYKQIMQE